MGRFNEFAMAIAMGVNYGLMMLLIGLASALTGWGKDIFDIFTSFFPGFKPTIIGSVIGAIWGVIWGFVSGYLLAAVYNLVAGKMK